MCPQETRDNKESEESDILLDTEENETIVPVWPVPQVPLPMERPSFSARHSFPITVVAGTQIGLNPCKNTPKKGCRSRGKDKGRRRVRCCSRCKKNKGSNLRECKGKGGSTYCEYFDDRNIAIDNG